MTYIITKHTREGRLAGYVRNPGERKGARKFKCYRAAMAVAKELNLTSDLCYSVDLAFGHEYGLSDSQIIHA